MPGVVRTRVGYAGGSAENPTYRNLGGHAETIQIDYDPTQISYEDLLKVFWASHSPTAQPYSRQYASIVFYHDDEQKRAAIETKERQATERGNPIYTEVVPFTAFHLAEEYHQKYRLRSSPQFMDEFRAMYPDPNDLVNSTAAARVNGYLSGYGTSEALEAELDSLGLSAEAGEKLLKRVP
jgi:methionine-S-sulfoxide reductase